MSTTKSVQDGLRLKRVRWHDHDGRVVIDGPSRAEDPSRRAAIVLNSSAALLWRRLTQGATREALITSLVQEFRIHETTAAADVDAFLSGLRDHGLMAEAV